MLAGKLGNGRGCRKDSLNLPLCECASRCPLNAVNELVSKIERSLEIIPCQNHSGELLLMAGSNLLEPRGLVGRQARAFGEKRTYIWSWRPSQTEDCSSDRPFKVGRRQKDRDHGLALVSETSNGPMAI